MTEKEKQSKYDKANTVLEKARKVMEEVDITKLSFSEFLKRVEVSEEDYHQSLSTMKRAHKVILERDTSEIWINNYNEEMLRAWNANMDIQVAYDPHAVVTYICDYAYKSDKGMTKGLKEALNAAKNKELEDQLRILCHEYLNQRQKGGPEALYGLMKHMSLKQSNISTQFVTTGFPESRWSNMDPVKEKEDDEEEEFGIDEFPDLDPEDGKETTPFKNQKTSKQFDIVGKCKNI